jgi:hypothetical protein
MDAERLSGHRRVTWNRLAGVALPDQTFLSPNKTIAVRVLPGVVLQVFSGKMTREEFESTRPLLDHPILGDRYVQLTRLAPSGVKEAPDPDFRARAAESVRERERRIVAFAYVLIGEGFVASVARTVIAGINVLSRPSFPQRVFPESNAALAWLAGQLPAGTIDPAQLLLELDDLIDLAGSKR